MPARQLPPTGMALKLKLFTRAAASAQVQQIRHGRLPVHVRANPGLRVARTVPITCDSNHTHGEGWRSPRRSRSLNQATSASVSLSRPLMGLAVTELEFMDGLCGGQEVSDVSLWDFQKQDDTHLQVLKISIELCKKEYFVVPKAKAESDLKFHDEEDEILGKKVWFQLISVEVDPGECLGDSLCLATASVISLYSESYRMLYVVQHMMVQSSTLCFFFP